MGQVKDGPQCPGCGLSNYEGLCPYCSGDQVAYERELVPPFPSSVPKRRLTIEEAAEIIRSMMNFYHDRWKEAQTSGDQKLVNVTRACAGLSEAILIAIEGEYNSTPQIGFDPNVITETIQ